MHRYTARHPRDLRVGGGDQPERRVRVAYPHPGSIDIDHQRDLIGQPVQRLTDVVGPEQPPRVLAEGIVQGSGIHHRSCLPAGNILVDQIGAPRWNRRRYVRLPAVPRVAVRSRDPEASPCV